METYSFIIQFYLFIIIIILFFHVINHPGPGLFKMCPAGEFSKGMRYDQE